MTLINPESSDPKNELISVIVTISDGPSYDNLFRAVKQESEENTRVPIYDLSSDMLPTLLN